jgi:hypothetical protein
VIQRLESVSKVRKKVHLTFLLTHAINDSVKSIAILEDNKGSQPSVDEPS